MLLRSTLTSPYGRKVLMAADHLDLPLTIAPVDTMDPHDVIREDNPLGKMPVLVLDDGRRLYDSPVILEYLDHLGGVGSLIPRDVNERFDCLTLQALADGMLDAALLILYEERRPCDRQHEPWIDRQRQKIVRGLKCLEAGPPVGSHVTVGSITVACMLSYLDRRKAVDWRAGCPALVRWLGDFAESTPSFGRVLT